MKNFLKSIVLTVCLIVMAIFGLNASAESEKEAAIDSLAKAIKTRNADEVKAILANTKLHFSSKDIGMEKVGGKYSQSLFHLALDVADSAADKAFIIVRALLEYAHSGEDSSAYRFTLLAGWDSSSEKRALYRALEKGSDAEVLTLYLIAEMQKVQPKGASIKLFEEQNESKTGGEAGFTVLHKAVMMRNKDIVTKLVGVAPSLVIKKDGKDGKGNIALTYAIKAGLFDIVRVCLSVRKAEQLEGFCKALLTSKLGEESIGMKLLAEGLAPGALTIEKNGEGGGITCTWKPSIALENPVTTCIKDFRRIHEIMEEVTNSKPSLKRMKTLAQEMRGLLAKYPKITKNDQPAEFVKKELDKTTQGKAFYEALVSKAKPESIVPPTQQSTSIVPPTQQSTGGGPFTQFSMSMMQKAGVAGIGIVVLALARYAYKKREMSRLKARMLMLEYARISNFVTEGEYYKLRAEALVGLSQDTIDALDAYVHASIAKETVIEGG